MYLRLYRLACIPHFFVTKSDWGCKVRRHNFDKTDLNRIAKIDYGYIRGVKVDIHYC